MIRLIIFDLDNTLYPTHGQVKECRKAALDAMVREGLPFNGNCKALYKELKGIVKEYGSNYDGHYNVLVVRKYRKEIQEILGDEIKLPDKDHEVYKLLEQIAESALYKNSKILRERVGDFLYKTVRPIISAGATAYHKKKAEEMRLYYDTKGVLEKLLEEKYQLAILTDGLMSKQLEKYYWVGLHKFINKEDVWVTESKIDGECLEKMLDTYDVDPHEVMLVGDKLESDINLALDEEFKGMHAVHLLRGPYEDDKLAKRTPNYDQIITLKEIPDLIKKIDKKS